MKKAFKFTAKKVDQAISTGLETLGVGMDEAEINIISSGGLFKKAEVEITIEVADVAPALDATTEVIAESKPATPTVVQKKVQEQKAEKPQPKKEFKKESKKENSATKPAFAAKFSDKSGESFKEETIAPTKKPSAKLFEKKQQAPRSERPARERRNDRAEATEESANRAKAFLTEFLRLSGLETDLTVAIEGSLNITLGTQNPCIIGHRGEVLDNITYLTSLVVNGGQEKYVVVNIDALEYRAKRKESLQRLAQKMADKCLKNNRRMGLEPMNSSDRKEIHAYLQEIEGVITKSEGHEPNRRIVIYPERKK